MTIDTQSTLNAYNQSTQSNALENLEMRAKMAQAKNAMRQELQGTDSKTSLEKMRQDEDAKLREQTDNFEAILLQIMLKDAIKNENPLYPKQPGSDIYHSMYLENLADSLSGDFGYSELLFNYLKDLQK
ncbi:hypothetical protein ACWIWK_03260 [Helicobacter sp. 23-1048]